MMYGGGSMTKRASSRKGEKNFILRKPMPYNLYNVNQKEKEREVFTLEKWFYLHNRINIRMKKWSLFDST